MTTTSTESRVIALVSDILGVPVTLESSMDNVSGWDSLKHMQVIFAFEDAFALRLNDGEIVALRSIKALVERANRGT